MIFNVGELALIEYGNNEILGTCRTEQMSPHLISARINYSKDSDNSIKVIAYLLDATSLCVQDLKTNSSIAMINHDSRVDFLELNPRGTKLLFRDKRRQLHLFNIRTQTRSTLLNYCSYVQWVPSSDVVVAQSRTRLNVWYNIDDPDKVTVYNIKGEVEDIERNKSGTEVIVNEGMGAPVSYSLDEHLISFGYALENRDLDKAVQILEPLESTPEGEANWKALAEAALEEQNLAIAEHCYAALGDVAKSRMLHKVNKLAEAHEQQTNQRGTTNYLVQARLAMLSKQFHRAEAILLDQNDVEEAMEMYQELHRWDEIINIGRKRNHPKLKDLEATYFNWLVQSNQEEKAAEVKEQDGDYEGAINWFLAGKLPARAAGVVNRYNLSSQSTMEKVAAALQSADLHEKAGEFFEKLNMMDKALEAYVRGNAYRKAVDLARRDYPAYVERLEEKWGDYLVAQKQMDSSINHFIEANSYQKAIEAAIKARQWTKAVQLLGSQSQDTAKPYYKQIARHYSDIRQLEQAEKLYMKANAVFDVFEMYTCNNKWDQAYRFACAHMAETEVTVLYTKQGQKLEQEGRFKDAERMFLTVNEPDLAINMYKKAGNYEAMIRLVSKHRNEKLRDVHVLLAQQFETEGKLKEAEHHYLEASQWNLAVDLYRRKNMLGEALRVAKAFGGSKEIADVARKWVETESVRGERGSSLLIKQGLVEPALELEMEQNNFTEAFKIADKHCKHRKPEVHLNFALFLEDERRFNEAEEEFVKAGKASEAAHMYQHTHDFHSALRVAKQFEPALVADIVAAQAKYHIDQGEYKKAEQALVSGKMYEKVVEMYVQARMHNEAIRVAQSHAPHLVGRIMAMKDESSNAEELKQNARLWEQNREFVKAIDSYLSITESSTSDFDLLEEVWEKAVQLAMSYDKDRVQQIVVTVGRRLMSIHRAEAAADMYATIGQYEEAVKCFIAAQDFDKATELVNSVKHTEIAPKLRQLVEAEKKQFFIGAGDAGGMTAFNPSEGLEMYIRSGDWQTALQKARQVSQQALNDVLMRFTKKSTEEGNFGQALKAFGMYGSPSEPGFLEIYKTLSLEVLADCQDEEVSDLKIVLKNLLDNTYDRNSLVYREFQRYFFIIQLVSLKSVYKNRRENNLWAKTAVSLLRYTNEARVDKAFYDAGAACRENTWLNMAFVFLNRYLDIAEAIEDPEGGAGALGDTADFANTDIPTYDIPLPESNFLPDEQREQLRDWVLQVSMDQKVEQKLTTRNCEQCGAEIYAASLRCGTCSFTWEPCQITGYPVLPSTGVSCSNCNSPANRAEWNTYLNMFSSCPTCGSIQSQSY